MEQMRPPDDEALVERAKSSLSGDLRAFEALVERHQGRVLANCRYLTGSADDAQDLAQDVFVKVYFALRRFRGESAFGTWVQRIKVNRCLNFLRRRKGRSFLDVEDPVLEAEPELSVAAQAEARVAAGDQRQAIRAVLERMPGTLRVPLVMRDLDGLSYQEIADSLDLRLPAVKMRIKRGREEFRRLYRRIDPEGAERWDQGNELGAAETG